MTKLVTAALASVSLAVMRGVYDDPPKGSEGGGNDPPAAPEFLKGVSDDTLKVIRDAGYDKATDLPDFVGKVFTDYSALKDKAGKVVSLPGPDVDDDGWKAFQDAMRPKDASAIKFKLPDNLPKDFPYDSDFATGFQKFAHEQGIHPRHAAAMHDWYVQQTAGKFTESVEGLDKETSTAHTELVKKWGEPGSASYKEEITHLQQAVKALGGDPLMKELVRLGAVTPTGDVRSPILAQALATVGGALYGEDDLLQDVDSGGVPRGKNPFKKDQENATLQSQIIKQDPDLAKRLMREAGVDPKEYQMA